MGKIFFLAALHRFYGDWDGNAVPAHLVNCIVGNEVFRKVTDGAFAVIRFDGDEMPELVGIEY